MGTDWSNQSPLTHGRTTPERRLIAQHYRKGMTRSNLCRVLLLVHLHEVPIWRQYIVAEATGVNEPRTPHLRGCMDPFQVRGMKDTLDRSELSTPELHEIMFLICAKCTKPPSWNRRPLYTNRSTVTSGMLSSSKVRSPISTASTCCSSDTLKGLEALNLQYRAFLAKTAWSRLWAWSRWKVSSYVPFKPSDKHIKASFTFRRVSPNEDVPAES